MSALRYDDRRDSPRFLTTVWVRGLGADWYESERLGDIGMGGVGFEVPEAPAAEVYMVKFSCPGEQRLRKAFADVIDATPLPGTKDRQGPFFVHLRFRDMPFEDERALARALDQAVERDSLRPSRTSVLDLAAGPYFDFEIEEAEHSLLPAPTAEPAEDTPSEPEIIFLSAISCLPEKVTTGQGGLGDYLWGYLRHEYRPQ